MSPQDRYTAISAQMPGTEPGNMFGKPCLKVNGKAFACFFQDCMVFKLDGLARQQAMMLEGSQLFDPSGQGRAMKEWVQVPFSHQTLWDEFAREAVEKVEGVL